MNVIVTKKNRPTAGSAVSGGDELNIQRDRQADPPPLAPTPPLSESSSPPVSTDLVTKALALIPAEVTTLFVALHTAVSEVPDSSAKHAPAVFIPICAILVVLQLRHLGRAHAPPVKPLFRQYLLSVLAFLAWSASIADPLEPWRRSVPQWILTGGIILIPFVGALSFEKD